MPTFKVTLSCYAPRLINCENQMLIADFLAKHEYFGARQEATIQVQPRLLNTDQGVSLVIGHDGRIAYGDPSNWDAEKSADMAMTTPHPSWAKDGQGNELEPCEGEEPVYDKTKKLRLCYRSEGTDGQKIVCDSIENAINCFRADAEAFFEDLQRDGLPFEIELTTLEMSDAEIAAVQEV